MDEPKVRVRFLRATDAGVHGGFNANEEAGFPKDAARALVAKGCAEYIEPESAAPEGVPAPKAAKPAKAPKAPAPKRSKK